MRTAAALAGAAIAATLTVSCSSSPTATSPTAPSAPSSTATVRMLQVAPSLAACTGVTEQTCLQVRDTADAPWRLLYDAITGFDYEPGFLYEIQVQEETVANPPADASSIRRTLLAIISKTPAARSLVGPTWRLASLEGRPALDGVKVTAVFAAGDRISGSGGCNRYVGGASVQGDSIKVGALAATRMFCGPGGVSAQEDAYFALLAKATSYRIVNSELLLGPSPGEATLVFRAE